ncbi:hypothetical protein SUDANB176_07499 (plasmid) [Streptomyces sp. enrichment culture]|uniref:hypothetical protein n=1 Tax=Streptomyces sp. enrichment culture TaxID=1795815 RepID=UPI003F56B414
MPSRWTLTSVAEAPDHARPIPSAQLHGAAAALVEPPDGDHLAQTKPYSVAPLRNVGEGQACLHISCPDDTDRPRPEQFLGERIRFGSRFFRLTAVDEDHVPCRALLPPRGAGRSRVRSSVRVDGGLRGWIG